MIWNPWRRVRELEVRLGKEACEHAQTKSEMAVLERSLHIANERYDGIRRANAALRETLDLYREASR